MKKALIILAAITLLLTLVAVPPAAADDASTIIQKAVAYMRGKTSVSTAKMTIHRPDWQRYLTFRTWTRGTYKTLTLLLAPKEDFGNGILKLKSRMWQYNPKVNRIIKVPPSMMDQSYMGSDFSNDDLSKDEDVFNYFSKTIVGTATNEGKTVHIIECLPKKDAPVVWGMVMVHVREDNIIIKEMFYDEDHKLVKTMTVNDIQMISGKLFPTKVTMAQVKTDHYTVSELQEVVWDKPLEDRIFTLTNLQNPME